MSAKLIAEEGFLKELILSFEEGDQWIIGRDPDECQMLVEDPAASRKHAICRRTSQGISIENLSASNPVLVNDEPVAEPRTLQAGDGVKIGDTLFRFYPDPSQSSFESQPEPSSVLEVPKKENTLFEEEAEKEELAQVNFDLLATGRWLLKVLSGPNSGAEFSMQSGHSYLIGTDPNTCDIVFYDTSVSRQHARIVIESDESMTIEDLKSRNGTRIQNDLIEGKQPFSPNTVVTLGTSSFVVYDREGEMQTIISPLLPSIVKVLQKEEAKSGESPASGEQTPAEMQQVAAKEAGERRPTHALGAFILIGILVGLFGIAGIGIKTLFTQEEVKLQEPANADEINAVVEKFPGVKHTFNKATGKILIVGHVLTLADRNELLYLLKGLRFVKEVDDSGVVIDEYVWSEANQVLTKNPNWRGITIHSSSPGHFIVSGYLQTRNEAELVWDYLSRNFPYVDLLENKMIVEEDLVNTALRALHEKGFNAVKATLSGGELSLTGNIPRGKKQAFDELVETFKQIPGIRGVKNSVAEVAPQEAVINLTGEYFVSGLSQLGNGKLSVVINGRILTEGDTLDGMKIVHVQSNSVYLEKDGVSYKIDITR